MANRLSNTETALLLARIAALDSRTAKPAAVEAFAAALIPMTQADAIAAIDYHRETSTEWLMPAHLNQIVKTWRAERIKRAGDPIPPAELANQPHLEIKWRRAWLSAVGDGYNPVKVARELDTQFVKEIAS